MLEGALSGDEIKKLAEKFDATEEFVKLDQELVKGMGLSKDICHSTQDSELYAINSLLSSSKNLNTEKLKELFNCKEASKYLLNWVVLYRGRTCVPLDMFAEGLSHLS